jgi:hypothetical protein
MEMRDRDGTDHLIADRKSFELVGRFQGSTETMGIVNVGFETFVGLGDHLTKLVGLRPEKNEVLGLICAAFVTLAGPVAIVTFRVSSLSDIPHNVNISLTRLIDFGVSYNLYSQCDDFGTGTGFYATEPSAGEGRVNFFSRQDGLFANADAYCFGSSSACEGDPWAQSYIQSRYGQNHISISWSGRVIRPHSEMIMSTVISWGIPPSDAPILDVSWPAGGEELTNVSGRIAWAAGDSVWLFIAIGEDHSRLHELGTFVSGSTFMYELCVQTVNHTVTVYAIDSNGAMSKSQSRAAPTAQFTQVPSAFPRRRFLRAARFVLVLAAMP